MRFLSIHKAGINLDLVTHYEIREGERGSFLRIFISGDDHFIDLWRSEAVKFLAAIYVDTPAIAEEIIKVFFP